MRKLTTYVLLAVTGLFGPAAFNVNAQNLFRAGPPDYRRSSAQAFQPNTTTRYSGRNQAWTPVDRLPRTDLRDQNTQANIDYDRLRSAWELYRQEALRYQRRYGDSRFAEPYGTVPVRAGRPTIPRTQPSSLEPVNTLSNTTQRDPAFYDDYRVGFGGRACSRRPAADLRPRLEPSTPVSPYRDSVDYQPADSSRAFGERDVVRPLVPVPTNSLSREPDQRRERIDYRARTRPELPLRPSFDPAKVADRAANFFATHLND